MANVTTATATLGLDYTFNSAPRSYDIDLVLNVYRRHESILYRSQNTLESANISFFASQALLSTSALNIDDKSASLIANRIEKLDKPVAIEGFSEYFVPTDKVVVTDVYAAENNSNQSAPLFYQHVLSTDNLIRVSSLDDYTVAPDYKLTSVEVVDINFDPIRLDNIKIDYDLGLVYNNLASSFDQETGVAVVYYLRYSVQDPDGDITSYVELVNNQPIFLEADFADLDEELNVIDDGRKVYLIEEQENSLKVKLPHVGNYSFQLLDTARIRILEPPQSDKDDVWNVSVSNGRFFSNIAGTQYRYSIAEFVDQAWDPEQPYKKIIEEDAEFISANLVKVRNPGVFYNPTLSGYLDLLVYDADDNAVAAFTTDPTKTAIISDNTKAYETWSVTSKTGIRSVDGKTGIIDLDGIELRSDYKFKSNYFYEEKNYQFSHVDFNPVNNPEILTRFVSLFVDPDTASTAKPQTLYFTVTDRAGKVVGSNLPNFDNEAELILTDDAVWREAYFETIPSYITPSPGAILFLPQYTVIGSGLFLPLGDIHVTEDTHPDQSTKIDVRVRGGGIRDDEVEAAKALQQEVGWYWDLGFWDGTPYPGNASYFVEVPSEVLEVAGGTLKAEQIRSVIDRHTAAGVYAIAKAYGIDPVISGVIPGDTAITIKWSTYN